MDFTERSESNYTVVEPLGRLNLVAAAPLKARLLDLVANGQANIVIDLAGVDFIDSSGLGTLIAARKVAQKAGGDLRIANVGDQIQAVLRLTNLNSILIPYDSVKAAASNW